MLPASPPTGQSPVIREGMAGWPVFSLQSYLNAVFGSRLLADGAFGPATVLVVREFQAMNGLVADAVAGPATQSKLVIMRVVKAEAALPALPDGLLKGKLLSEGGLLLAPVNWSIVGGVDCGAAQYRVYGPPYAQQDATEGASLWEAFGPACVRMAADDFLDRRRDYLANGNWSGGSAERAGRCAALAHNWPVGATYYSDHGHAPSPSLKATWVPSGIRFPDGTPVVTRQDWCEFYAMGGSHGEGVVTRFVTSWA